MAKKRALILLLALSTLLVITLLVNSLYIFKSNPVKQKGLKGNAQKISGLADTTENIHLDLIFDNIHLQNPRELVGKIQYLWGPAGNQPIDASIYTSAYVP